MTKLLKIVVAVLLVVAIGWSIPKFFIKDDTGLLNEHIVAEKLDQTLNRPADKFLLLQTKVSSSTSEVGPTSTISTVYVNAYTLFGIKYTAVKLDCLQGMFFSGCSGAIIK